MNISKSHFIAFLCVHLVAAPPAAIATQTLRARCLESRTQLAVDSCKALAVHYRADLSGLMRLGATLETKGHDAAATAVYGQGLAFCQPAGRCAARTRRELVRRHRLALSNARESQQAGSTLGLDPSVASRVSAIKCRHLSGDAAADACRLIQGNNPDNAALVQAGTNMETRGTHWRSDTAVSTRNNLQVQRSPVSSKRTPRNVLTPASGNAASNALASIETDAERSRDRTSVVDKVRTLLQLVEADLITQEEFELRKRAVLDTALQPTRGASFDSPALTYASTLADSVDFGRFHALVIGNNAYERFPKLETAVADARAVAEVLRADYGFSVQVLVNAPRYQVLKALAALRASLSENDNLLVYYAGHGYLDEATTRGYWLPVDAEEDNTANWISTSEITDALHALPSLHAIVVADSCYSGALTRASRAALDERGALIRRLTAKRSRTVLTSGGLEPVLDSGSGGHSVFANALLDVLEDNRDVIEGSRLFAELRQRVVLDGDQTPEYADIRNARHEGGDFMFVRRSSASAR
ncbi:MAG: caspase family protein [Gammaproteobacteria bacterium]